MELSNLIKQLQNTNSYPHVVETTIKVIQTHISAIFLTGDYAYKIKKPVNFGFLDYSSMEKRQHFLNQELTMNQAIAPDIYLDVLPITIQNEQVKIGGEGEIIDYIRSFGDIEVIKKSIDENYEITDKYIGIIQTKEKYQETKNFTDSYFKLKQDYFRQRKQENKIRECHGDLHLKNICLWNNKIQLFDRIEFNEEFRYVDVMCDVAFSVLDLDARNRQDLSNIFLNTYLENTGDRQVLQHLPVYLSRQAYVRAQVNSMILDDPNISQENHQKAQQEAKNYYHLAWKYTQQHQGKIIIMSGLSGSGKTTVAKYIAEKINGILIRSDAVRKHLGNVSLDETGNSELYSEEMNQKTYERLIKLGEIVAKEGFNLILDAKFDRHQLRKPVMEIAKKDNIFLTILSCYAPVEILSDRLSKRKGDISDATSDLLQQQKNNIQDFNEEEMSYVKKIDTTNNWKEQITEFFR